MFKILLAVRVVSDGEVHEGYVRELLLPFIPTLGMRFEQGTSTTLWETREGEEYPGVEKVIYDLDEENFVCLFTVSKPLSSSFWTTLSEPKPGSRCGIMEYFRHHPIKD